MNTLSIDNDNILKLHSTLEITPLLTQFMSWVRQHIPFTEMHYHHPQTGIFEVITASKGSRGDRNLQVSLGRQGKLYFLRDREFSHEEEQTLRHYSDNLSRPLTNALQYHTAQRQCEQLNQRLQMSEKTCHSLSQIDGQKQHISLGDLISHHDLHYALNNDALTVFYQPKVDLKTGSVMGLEALIRWHHAEQGLLSADKFIPLAENHGLIQQITRWVLSTVLQQCAEWKELGLLVPVAVNLSCHDLEQSELPDYLADQLSKWNIPAEYLELEITETSAIENPECSIDVLKRLSSLGVDVAIDDFGIGYSSLHRLKHLPVDTIKIDKSFIMENERGEHGGVFVDSITHLGHKLGMKVVAEGVDSHESWQQLQASGCDMAQGFHISRPLSGEATTGWLRDSSAFTSHAPLH